MRAMTGWLPAAALAALAAGCGSSSSAGSTGSAGTPGAAGHAGAEASCAAPTLALQPDHAAAGDTLTATGEWYAADCYDTGQQGTPPALAGLSVQVVQGGRSWPLASGIAATGDHYRIEVPITLPAELKPGAAEVRVDDYAKTPLQITAGRP